jgi:hypothetical protein
MRGLSNTTISGRITAQNHGVLVLRHDRRWIDRSDFPRHSHERFWLNVDTIRRKPVIGETVLITGHLGSLPGSSDMCIYAHACEIIAPGGNDMSSVPVS